MSESKRLARVLVNDQWLDVDADGKTVGELVSQYADRIHHTNSLSLKADGILLAHSVVLSDEKILEVVELPYLASDSDEDAG